MTWCPAHLYLAVIQNRPPFSSLGKDEHQTVFGTIRVGIRNRTLAQSARRSLTGTWLGVPFRSSTVDPSKTVCSGAMVPQRSRSRPGHYKRQRPVLRVWAQHRII